MPDLEQPFISVLLKASDAADEDAGVIGDEVFLLLLPTPTSKSDLGL